MKPKVILKNVSKNFVQKGTQKENLKGLFFKKKRKEFQAVKNVSFEIMSGETVGLIGINGSGKSTLSNIISKIIPPTSGELVIDGQPTLIAIGAGLHENLTGKENVYLKCLMMGLSKNEVDSIYPKILEFSEIGEFIEQKFKTYSSGMKSRLGFAISIHIEPDILVVDEALSVGDQTFRQKCHDKIDEFKRNGKTIVFVSHSVVEMKKICDRVAWIHQGNLMMYGPTNEVLDLYTWFVEQYTKTPVSERPELSKRIQEQLKKDRTELKDDRMTLRTQRRVKEKRKKKKRKRSFAALNTIALLLISMVIFLGAFLMLTSDQESTTQNETVETTTVDETNPSEENSTSRGEEIESEPTTAEEEVVVGEESPTITFESDHIVIEQNGTYDLRAGMTIEDDLDSEEVLLDNLDIYADPVFDISIPGVYQLTYVVTDSNGNEVNAERTFEVVPVEEITTEEAMTEEEIPVEE